MPIDVQNFPAFTQSDLLRSDAAVIQLDKRGWVRIDDVPADKDAVEYILSSFGPILPQYSGIKFWDVIPKNPGKGSSVGDREISFHTELAEFPEPPRYVALYCLRPAATGGALLLLDLRPLLNSFSTSQIDQLLRDDVTVYCAQEIATEHGNLAFTAPVLCRRDDRLAVRYDPPSVDDSSPSSLRDFTDLMLKLGEQSTVSFIQPAGSLVIWDNWRVVHGRTAFEGADRHLWRCCIKAPAAAS